MRTVSGRLRKSWTGCRGDRLDVSGRKSKAAVSGESGKSWTYPAERLRMYPKKLDRSAGQSPENLNRSRGTVGIFPAGLHCDRRHRRSGSAPEKKSGRDRLQLSRKRQNFSERLRRIIDRREKLGIQKNRRGRNARKKTARGRMRLQARHGVARSRNTKILP